MTRVRTRTHLTQNVHIEVGDCREVLARMEPNSVHCVVTSPPYWGLRNYDGPELSWGGDENCRHEWRTEKVIKSSPDGGKNAFQRPGRQGNNFEISQGRTCNLCDMWQGQLGAEPIFNIHICNLVNIFRAVRRVLHPNGTFWLNYGDRYESKNLLMLPARLALALQDDGWLLRSEIIWNKTNPVPESVTDRPTSAHEKIYLFSKSKKYFYNAESVYTFRGHNFDKKKSRYVPGNKGLSLGNEKKNGVRIGSKTYTKSNIRNVWSISVETSQIPGSHKTLFPKELVSRCLAAGCPSDGTALDPFGGSGTVGLVAKQMGRKAILIEINSKYADESVLRIAEET